MLFRSDERASNYIMGIECDGAMYHSSISARERDIFRLNFLESRGWIIHRIWSRKWWENQDKEIEKIKEELNKKIVQIESNENVRRMNERFEQALRERNLQKGDK